VSRPNWDDYFLDIALMVARRSTCSRASVGAVIVKDNCILSTGYNGSPTGQPHCTDVGCTILNDHCVNTLHAEANAISFAKVQEIDLRGSTLYYWDSKHRKADSVADLKSHCQACGHLAEIVGISRVVGR